MALAIREDTKALMEATGRYHEPVAAALREYGIRVTVMNPLFIKQSGGSIRKEMKTIQTMNYTRKKRMVEGHMMMVTYRAVLNI